VKFPHCRATVKSENQSLDETVLFAAESNGRFYCPLKTARAKKGREMEIGVEQETDYKYETPEVHVIIEDDPEFSIGIYEPSNLVEAERAQEYGVTTQRYAVEDDCFYPLEYSEELGSNSPLSLNDEQQNAVQIALLGGESTVEILAPGSTDEMEVWSVQTFTFGGVVDGRQAFILSARSEERPKLREEPEADFDRDSGYDNFEPSLGDEVSVSAHATSYEIPGHDVAPVDANSEDYDLDVSTVGESRANILLYGVNPVEQLAEIFSEPGVVTMAQGDVERVRLIITDAAEVGEGAAVGVGQDRVVESVDVHVKFTPSMFKIEAPEITAIIADEQDRIDQPIGELVITTVVETKGCAAGEVEQSAAEVLLDDFYEPQIESVETQVEHRLQTPPAVFQPNETIYVREQASVLSESDVITRAVLVGEQAVAEPRQYVEPSLQVECEVVATKLIEGQETQQVPQVIVREVVDERVDGGQQEAFIPREPSIELRKESRKGETVGMLNPEITSRQSKKAVLHTIKPAAWERAGFVIPSVSRSSVFNATEDGDDIVISFEPSPTVQRIRKARAKSLAV